MQETGSDRKPFSEHFGFRLPAIVNFVGGGGKTGLILALLDEYSVSSTVLYTTTTRIHPPVLRNGLAIISCQEKQLLKHLLSRLAGLVQVQKGTFVVTRPGVTPGLLQGVDPDFGAMLETDSFPLVLNEADGARSMSIKFPREGEPVLMEGANYLVPVIGLDCLNRPIGPETLFRWELASARLSLEPGVVLTPPMAAGLLLHPQGVCKGWKPDMRIIPFINKADSADADGLARELAHAMLQDRNFPVDRVLWGSVQHRRVLSLAPHRQ
jgi:probable selenium-dependent hydroxylase accessory protein YqeC